MRRRGEERAADDSGPERVAARDVEREVQDVQFSLRSGDVHHLADSAGDVLEQHDDGGRGADQVDAQLDHVGPDERGHPSEKRVHDHRGAQHDDRGDEQPHGRVGARQPGACQIARAGQGQEEGTQHQAGGKQPEAVRQRSRDQEEAGCQLLDRATEAIAEQLVDGQHFAAEVGRHKEQAHHEPAHDVAERELQEGEVGAEGVAGDADEGDGAGLGRDDRRHYNPPGQVAVADEVVLEVALPPGKPRAEQHRAGQIGGDDREVEIRHQIMA